ncbi:MAG TPA: ankyrin repeat domain-containing protein [Ktedonobacterales bacterium]|nr:ankyrin repeat domain-containing protein [Ktedonobacterales bacterium]
MSQEEQAALDPTLVHEFVLQAHGDLSRVNALLDQEPRLINAAWDWGGGDWETALGAAAHMGRKDIAQALLARGARLDVFAAAMLGKLEIIQAVLAAFPDALHVPGPHGIPLVQHARVGGEEAAPVTAFLESLLNA